jgi:hypothetical protein
MEDQLVSLETAKLAKEKGFNIQCREGYYETEEHTLEIGRGGDCNFPYQAPRVLSKSCQDNYTKIIAEAPTKSLLQKWLREVHNIIVEVWFDETQTDGFPWLIGSILVENVCINDENHSLFGTYFDNYEEALEIGLKEAVNLVK